MFFHIAEVLPAVRDYIRANMPPRGDYERTQNTQFEGLRLATVGIFFR